MNTFQKWFYQSATNLGIQVRKSEYELPLEQWEQRVIDNFGEDSLRHFSRMHQKLIVPDYNGGTSFTLLPVGSTAYPQRYIDEKSAKAIEEGRIGLNPFNDLDFRVVVSQTYAKKPRPKVDLATTLEYAFDVRDRLRNALVKEGFGISDFKQHATAGASNHFLHLEYNRLHLKVTLPSGTLCDLFFGEHDNLMTSHRQMLVAENNYGRAFVNSQITRKVPVAQELVNN